MTDTLDTSEVYVPETVKIAIGLIQVNAWNPNEMGELEFDLLVEQIKDVGFIQPIQVVPLTNGLYRVLGGAHRLQAAKILGMKEIPCVVLSDAKWNDEDLQKFVTVRLNQLHGKTNSNKMIALYREMEEKYGPKALQRMFTYTEDDAWKKLVRSVKKSVKQSGLSDEEKKKFNNQSKDAKSVEDLSEILTNIFNEHGDTLKQSFIVFSFGGKEHLYVAMSPKTKKIVDEVITYCREWGQDVNTIMAKATEAWLKEAKAQEQEALEATAEEN